MQEDYTLALLESDCLSVKAVVEEIESWLGRPFPNSIRQDYLSNDLDAMILASKINFPDLSDAFEQHKNSCCLIASNSEPWTEQMPRFATENPHCEFHHYVQFNHAELYWNAKLISEKIIDFVKNNR